MYADHGSSKKTTGILSIITELMAGFTLGGFLKLTNWFDHKLGIVQSLRE